MERPHWNPSAYRGFLGVVREATSGYAVRVMLTTCASLLLMVAITKIPLEKWSPRIGWFSTLPLDRIQLSVQEYHEFGDEGETVEAHATPTIDSGLFPGAKSSGSESQPGTSAEESPPSPPIARVDSREVLNFAQQQPKVMGGIGNFYLNIDYPEEAREAGIQGRVLLTFVVEPTGRPTEIAVEQSLHPSCDSAAVAALEKSRFVAAEHNGRKVAVRMRLPVLFQLIDHSDEPILSSSQN